MTLLRKPVIELACGLALAAVLSEATAMRVRAADATAEAAASEEQVAVERLKTVILPHKWSVTARYETKIDFEHDNYVTHFGKLYLSKTFQKVPISFTASIKKPFNTGNKDYQVNFAVTYFFSKATAMSRLRQLRRV